MPDLSFRVLAESPEYILGHSFESVVAVRKTDGSEIVVGDHYGDPKLGLITCDQTWLVTAGEGLQCYSFQTGLHTFFRRGFAPLGASSSESCWFVHSARLDSPNVVRVLIDPWSQFSSVWLVDLNSLSVSRWADGPFPGDSPYREQVEY